MSTHNIDFYEDLTKIIFELSSNMHLISSAVIEMCHEKICLQVLYQTVQPQKTARYLKFQI